MKQIPMNYTSIDKVMIINPDGTVSYEPNLHYQQPTVIRRTYSRPPKPKYRYKIEQEGKSYRCCRWCRYWCTRKCSLCSCCDEIFSCPLICYILGGLLLLSLLAGILTLFGLHPNINSSRRYYGIISTLSIVNKTTYVYGLDKVCNLTGRASICFNLTTSTQIINFATTVILSQASSTSDYSYIEIVLCLIICPIYRKILHIFI